MQKLFGVAVVLGSGLTAGAPAVAVQIAGDSFVSGTSDAYTAGGNLAGQPNGSPPNSFGFSGTYVASTGLVTSTATGLTTALYSGQTGGGINVLTQFNAGDGATRQSNRAVNAYAPSSVYWFSGLMQAPAVQASGRVAFAGFSSFASTSSTASPNNEFGLYWGVNGGNFVVRARTVAGAGTDTTLGAYGTATNLFVAKLEPLTAADGNPSATEDRLTVWLNPAGVGSEAALGAPTVASFQTDAVGPLGTEISRINFVSNYDVATPTVAVIHDELRFGTDLASVTSAALPEPGSAALAAFAAVGLLARRRTRRA